MNTPFESEGDLLQVFFAELCLLYILLEASAAIECEKGEKVTGNLLGQRLLHNGLRGILLCVKINKINTRRK